MAASTKIPCHGQTLSVTSPYGGASGPPPPIPRPPGSEGETICRLVRGVAVGQGCQLTQELLGGGAGCGVYRGAALDEVRHLGRALLLHLREAHLAPLRPLPSHQLPQHDAKAVDVDGTRAAVPAQQDLWCRPASRAGVHSISSKWAWWALPPQGPHSLRQSAAGVTELCRRARPPAATPTHPSPGRELTSELPHPPSASPCADAPCKGARHGDAGEVCRGLGARKAGVPQRGRSAGRRSS